MTAKETKEMARVVRERDDAVAALKRYLDTQTESCIYVADALRKQKQYIQTDRISVKVKNGTVEIDALPDGISCRSPEGFISIRPVCGNVVEILVRK